MSITVPAPHPELAAGLDSPLRVLDLDGPRLPEPLLDPYIADVDLSALTGLYVDMVRVRRLDTEAFALTRQGRLVLWPPLLGQEAAQVGPARALGERDWVFGSYREHGFALLRGTDMADLARIWKAYAHGGWDPHEIRMAPSQIIIGAQTLHGTGFAMAAKLEGSDDVALTTFGDGATSEGDVNEALVWASAFQVPVVFLCQNNGYAISEPVHVQSGVPLALRPTGFGIPSMRVDGNDALATHAAARIALERARSGGGPTFIEAVTYRRGPHTTTDDPKRYRSDDEVENWIAKDPIDRVERALARMGANMEAVRAEAKIRADELAKEFRAAAEHAEPPTSEVIFEHVYAQPTKRLERQRAEHRAAVNAALADALEGDDRVLLMGEDIGKLGGVFRVTDGLQARFGPQRVIDSPLAESAIIGTAIGMSYRGFRVVAEIQFDGFIYPACDQIVAQLAKLRYRSRGRVTMPLTIRVPYGGAIGSIEHHSESPESYFAHTAGLRVVTASTPQEAYSTLRAAIASDDPVLFFEPKGKYYLKGEVDRTVERDLETANVVAAGRDVTILRWTDVDEPILRHARSVLERAARAGRG